MNAFSRSAVFVVVEDSPERLVISDNGPWSDHPTVTNDAEGAVERPALYWWRHIG